MLNNLSFIRSHRDRILYITVTAFVQNEKVFSLLEQ